MTVALISTGGTIASTDDSGNDASPELEASALIEAIPEIGQVSDIQTHDFANIPSAHLSIDQVYDLVQLIKKLDNNTSINGIVITQGTDVLEETSYFVDLCYDGDTPVAFTGAMRNPSLPSPDGPTNVMNSVRVVANDVPDAINVVVVFNDRVHAARSVTKVHSMNVDTFRSPEFGPLAAIDENRVHWVRSPLVMDETFNPDPEALTNDVFVAFVGLDASARQFRMAKEADGLCIATTGAGHVPPRVVPELRSLIDHGVTCVAATRCLEGRLAQSTYDFEGSERSLREVGAYFSDETIQKTRIKLIVALASDAINEAFSRP
jgi:L-asparaginase